MSEPKKRKVQIDSQLSPKNHFNKFFTSKNKPGLRIQFGETLQTEIDNRESIYKKLPNGTNDNTKVSFDAFKDKTKIDLLNVEKDMLDNNTPRLIKNVENHKVDDLSNDLPIECDKSPGESKGKGGEAEKTSRSEKRANRTPRATMNDESLLENGFCVECMVEVPLRARHCKDCGKCVATFDHHCVWIANCVGEKNKRLFYIFLLMHSLELIISFFIVNNFYNSDCA